MKETQIRTGHRDGTRKKMMNNIIGNLNKLKYCSQYLLQPLTNEQSK